LLKKIWNRIKSLQLRDLVTRDEKTALEGLEERFVLADFGMETTARILERVSSRSPRGREELERALADEICSILTPAGLDYSLHAPASGPDPSVFLLVGVNGTGKTTACAKLARKFMEEGHRVLLVAADTFRAGAAEQLSRWAERLGCDVLTQKMGADPASVLYDGIQAARSRDVHVVVVDTAGRLHSESMLMEELRKIRRVSAKLIPSAPHEILLVLDATTGQNAIRQAQTFHKALGLTGLVLCKMDGTSKGGIVVSIVDQLRIPVKLLGVGERPEDLLSFEPRTFAVRLLGLTEDAPELASPDPRHSSS